MNKILHIDFEVFSEAELAGKASVGLWNYWHHPSTEILMAGYELSYEKGKKLWEPHLDVIPEDLKKAILDPAVMISTFNSAYERGGLEKLGFIVPVSRFIDPQASARYLSLPGDLDEVSTILGLPQELAKDKRGKALIDLFCKPQKLRKKRGEEQKYGRNNWETHPAEWEEFKKYCVQDVVAEEEVSRREEILGALPLPPFERKVWEFDQKVNDRGIPTDVEFVQKMYRLAVRSKKEAKEAFEKLTGVSNANSPSQVKAWAKPQGYPFGTLRKETVTSVLKDPEIKLTDVCRQALQMRREAASTSYQKLAKILQQVSSDGRLRGQFIYLGSARCGRWAGNAVQLHNMARPGLLNGHDFEDQKVVREARRMVYLEDYDGIKAKYGSVLLVVKNLIRTVFVAEREAL